MLCRACEEFRFPTLTKKSSSSSSSSGRKKDGPSSSSSSASSRPVSETGHVVTRNAAGSSTSSSSVSQADQPPSTSAAAAAVSYVVNELLTYIGFYRNRANGDALRRVVLTYYTSDDISEAKKTVADLFRPTFTGSVLLTDRRNSPVRAAHEAELDDLIAMFDTLDEQHLLNSVNFVAINLEHLPKFGPEEVNICTVVSNHQKLSSTVNELAAEVDHLKCSSTAPDAKATAESVAIISAAMADFQHRIDLFQSSVNSRIDYLNNICSKFSQSTSAAAASTSSVSSNPIIDRASNIVVFGVAENRAVEIWKAKVDGILRFVVGRDVQVNDAFRMGSFREGKVRPILVKLSSAWDRRLILGSCKKLKDYTERVFVRPDEPIETRRKNTLSALKYKAQQANKLTAVNDDVLYIDGVPVFSLKDGMIRGNTNNIDNV